MSWIALIASAGIGYLRKPYWLILPIAAGFAALYFVALNDWWLAIGKVSHWSQTAMTQAVGFFVGCTAAFWTGRGIARWRKRRAST